MALNEQDDLEHPTFEFKVKTSPSTLDGINHIWELILKNEDSAVLNEALEFINKLNSLFSDDLKEEEKNFKVQYLKMAYKYLQDSVTHKESDATVMRCLKLMGSILDQSETKGDGDLKSLTSMSKGELLTLNLVNEEFDLYDVPRKFTVKIFSNKTVFDLNREVAHNLKTTWDEV